jgi:hypothetical protein
MSNPALPATFQSERRREQCVQDARRLLELLSEVSDPAHPRRRELSRLATAALACFARLISAQPVPPCVVCSGLLDALWPLEVRPGAHCAQHAPRFHAVVLGPFTCCEDLYDPDRPYAWRAQ